MRIFLFVCSFENVEGIFFRNCRSKFVDQKWSCPFNLIIPFPEDDLRVHGQSIQNKNIHQDVPIESSLKIHPLHPFSKSRDLRKRSNVISCCHIYR